MDYLMPSQPGSGEDPALAPGMVFLLCVQDCTRDAPSLGEGKHSHTRFLGAAVQTRNKRSLTEASSLLTEKSSTLSWPTLVFWIPNQL